MPSSHLVALTLAATSPLYVCSLLLTSGMMTSRPLILIKDLLDAMAVLA